MTDREHPRLVFCRRCDTVLPSQDLPRHRRACSGGNEMIWPATNAQIAAYEANLLAESVELERIMATKG